MLLMKVFGGGGNRTRVQYAFAVKSHSRACPSGPCHAGKEPTWRGFTFCLSHSKDTLPPLLEPAMERPLLFTFPGPGEAQFQGTTGLCRQRQNRMIGS